jgi:hypothetical protein
MDYIPIFMLNIWNIVHVVGSIVAKRDLYRILFPKQQKILETFGEDLLLAVKRRGLTKQMICDRTGFDNKTVNKVFVGDPSVAIGTYIKVMAVLGMEDNFAELAAHDEVGIKLQNIKLLEGSK